MGRWKPQRLARTAAVSPNSWEITVLTDDVSGTEILVGAVTGSQELAFWEPVGPDEDLGVVAEMGIASVVELPAPKVVIVESAAAARELRAKLARMGITVVVKPRLATIAAMSDRIAQLIAPAAGLGVTRGSSEWSETGRRLFEMQPWNDIPRELGFEVIGGRCSGQCLAFSSSDNGGGGGADLFDNADEFELSFDEEFTESASATLAVLVPVSSLSEADDAASREQGIIYAETWALQLCRMASSMLVRAGADHAEQLRNVLNLFLDLFPDGFASLPSQEYWDVPPNPMGVERFHLIYEESSDHRAHLILSPGGVRLMHDPEAPGGTAALIHTILPEHAEETVATMEPITRLEIERCVGCGEQRCAAYANDEFMVETGVISPESAFAANAPAEGEVHFVVAIEGGDAVPFRRTLPYTIVQMGHNGEPAPEAEAQAESPHANEAPPPRTRAIRSSARKN